MSARGPRWGSVRAPADDCMTAASIKDLLDKVVFVSSRWSPPAGQGLVTDSIEHLIRVA